MRKHFLILMLLTLLPLAGWAEKLTSSMFTVESPYYGNLPIVSSTLDDSKYDMVGYFSNSTATTSVTEAAVMAANAGETFYVKFTGKNGYEDDVIKSFVVKKMPLKVTVANDSKTYNGLGADDPAESASGHRVITGVKNLVKNNTGTAYEDHALADDDLTAIKALITISREAGKDVKAAAGKYKFTASISDDNYEIPAANVTGEFTITAKTLTRGTGAGKVTITVTNNEKIYSGAAQHPTVQVRDNDLAANIADADFTLTYSGSNTNVVDGGVYITISGKRNYTGDIVLNGSSDKKLIINKKPLSIWVDDVTKVYDGTTAIPAVTFSYSGLVGDDIDNTAPFGDNFTANYADGDATGKQKVGTYGLVASKVSPTGTWTNYEPSYPAIGQLTVTERPVTITVTDSKKFFGETDAAADPAFGYTVAGVAGNTGAIDDNTVATKSDKYWLERLYTVVRSNATEEGIGKYDKVLELQAKTAAAVKEEYTLSNADRDAVMAILDQYTITEKKGKFEIKAAALTVTPKKVIKTYGETYDITTFEVIATNSAGVRVTLNSPLPVVKFKEAEYNTKNPKNKGVYTLVVEGNIDAEGYDGAAATLNEGQLIINAKDLTITPQAQTLRVNDGKTDLRQYNTDDNKVTFTGLIKGDKIKYELDFNTTAVFADGLIPSADIAAVPYTKTTANAYNADHVGGCVPTGFTVTSTSTPNLTAVNAVLATDVAENAVLSEDQAYEYNSSITGAKKTTDNVTPAASKGYDSGTDKLLVAATYSKGIKLTTDFDSTDDDDMATYANNNYNITWNTAALTVVTASTFILDDADVDLANKLEVVNGTNNSIVFTSRELKKETWNVLVLPFATSAKELSDQLGYAVFNVLDTEKSDGNMHMKLWMGDIKANQPFLVKNYAAKNLNSIPAFAKDIVYDNTNADVDAIEIDTDGNSVVEDGSGNQFIGLYTAADIYGANCKYVTGKGVLKDASSYTSADPLTISPLRAYIRLANANARIFIEEPDGTTTVIESVNAEGVAVPAQGWYTINGVKLQGVPTEKGIYINNGKKVIIK